MQTRRRLLIERHETARERDELTISELLRELSALQTGVQILFAFLLGLAFTGRLASLDGFEVGTYVATLLITVLTSAVIATPLALHRRMGHSGSRPRIIPISARIAEVGRAMVALALSGAVLLVTNVVLGLVPAVCITLVTASVFATLWFLLPRAQRPSRSTGAFGPAGLEHPAATSRRARESRQP